MGAASTPRIFCHSLVNSLVFIICSTIGVSLWCEFMILPSYNRLLFKNYMWSISFISTFYITITVWITITLTPATAKFCMLMQVASRKFQHIPSPMPLILVEDPNFSWPCGSLIFQRLSRFYQTMGWQLS